MSLEEKNSLTIGLENDHINKIDQFRRDNNTSVLVIMFTDLKGSTAIAERRGERYAQHLREIHNRLLLDIIERDRRGLYIKNIGDSLMCVFAEPSTAVERALEIQQALHGYNAEHPEEEAIIVRIGLHMGQVSVEDTTKLDVFGRHVNRAARVESLADGGQIFMTYAVYDNAKGWLTDEKLAWANHGAYRLKGIDEPIYIYEVMDPSFMELKKPDGHEFTPPRPSLVQRAFSVILSIISVTLACFLVLMFLGKLKDIVAIFLLAALVIAIFRKCFGKKVETAKVTLKSGQEVFFFVRIKEQGYLFGVCAGLAYRFAVPTWVTRVLFVTLIAFGGMGIWLYIACALIMFNVSIPDNYYERLYSREWARRWAKKSEISEDVRPNTGDRYPFVRIKEEGLLLGVCAGLAYKYAMPIWIVRTLFVVLTPAGGLGVIMYVVCLICMTDIPTPDNFYERLYTRNWSQKL